MGAEEHGLRRYRTRGCRCAVCRAAVAEYQRDYQRRRKLKAGEPLRGRAQTPVVRVIPRAPRKLWLEVESRHLALPLVGFVALSVLALAIHGHAPGYEPNRLIILLTAIVAVVSLALLGLNWRYPAPCLLCGSRGSHTCSYRVQVESHRAKRQLVAVGNARFARSVPRKWRKRYAASISNARIVDSASGEEVWSCSDQHHFAAEARRCGQRALTASQRGFAKTLGFHPRGQRFDYEPGIRRGLQPIVWQEMVEKVGGACFYCGSVTFDPEADHVIPVSRGGASNPWNFVVACKTCNRKKGDQTGREFVWTPTETQLSKFDEIDRLRDQPRLRWSERKRLERDAERRKEAQRAFRRDLRRREDSDFRARRSWDYRSVPRPTPELLARYRARYKELHKRYGSALPKKELDALLAILNGEEDVRREIASEPKEPPV